MWQFIKRLFGKKQILSHAEIMAPLQKHLDSLQEANDARQEAIKATEERIKALQESNKVHTVECEANSKTIEQLKGIL